MKLISAVIPVYCERKNVPLIHEAISKELKALGGYDLEFVFVNDGSTDDSLDVLRDLAKKDPKVRVVDLARNFGKEIALSAGVAEAKGDAVICLDADLQHPPSYIPQMIKAWEEGAEIVEMVRSLSEEEPFLRKLGSDVFYAILGKLSEVDISPKTTDFRLLDRKVVNALLSIEERQRMFRGLVDWVGFRKVRFPFEAAARLHGQSVYSYAKLTTLALNSFISYSSLPLKIVGLAGVLITLFSTLLLLAMTLSYLLFGNPLNFSPLGFFTVFHTILIGLVLMALGLMSLYISKIYSESQNRPLYLIRERINL